MAFHENSDEYSDNDSNEDDSLGDESDYSYSDDDEEDDEEADEEGNGMDMASGEGGLQGEFVETVGTIGSCAHCNHYHQATSLTNEMLKNRCFQLNLKEICVSILLLYQLRVIATIVH